MVKLNKETQVESLDITISKEKTPIAFAAKVEELMEDGMSREEAEKTADGMVFLMEIYYETGCGLFAVECDAVEAGTIYSPYTGEECEQNEPEELQLWDGSLDEDELASEGLEIVTWPDSQMVMERNGFRDHSWLINSEEGLDLYGSSAYVVETEWYNN